MKTSVSWVRYQMQAVFFRPREQWIMGATSLWGFSPAHDLEECFFQKYTERYFLNEISKDVKVQSKSSRAGTAESRQEKASLICCVVYLPTSTPVFRANVEPLPQQLWPTWGWRCACMFVRRWTVQLVHGCLLICGWSEAVESRDLWPVLPPLVWPPVHNVCSLETHLEGATPFKWPTVRVHRVNSVEWGEFYDAIFSQHN